MKNLNVVFCLVIVLVCHSAVMGYSGGSGVAADPYLISTAADLVSLSSTSGDWDKHFRLEADLDMAAVAGFTPIGNSAYDNGDAATGNTVYGIAGDIDCKVTGNTAFSNGDFATGTVYGIYLSGYNLVDQNTAYSNGIDAGSATNMNLFVSSCVYVNNVAP